MAMDSTSFGELVIKTTLGRKINHGSQCDCTTSNNLNIQCRHEYLVDDQSYNGDRFSQRWIVRKRSRTLDFVPPNAGDEFVEDAAAYPAAPPMEESDNEADKVAVADKESLAGASENESFANASENESFANASENESFANASENESFANASENEQAPATTQVQSVRPYDRSDGRTYGGIQCGIRLVESE